MAEKNGLKEKKIELYIKLAELDEKTKKKGTGLKGFFSRIFSSEKRNERKLRELKERIYSELQEKPTEEIERMLLEKEKELEEFEEKHKIYWREEFDGTLDEVKKEMDAIKLERMMKEVEEKKKEDVREKRISKAVEEIRKAKEGKKIPEIPVKTGKRKEIKKKIKKIRQGKPKKKAKKIRKGYAKKKIKRIKRRKGIRPVIIRQTVIKAKGGLQISPQTIYRPEPEARERAETSFRERIEPAPAAAPAPKERSTEEEIQRVKEKINNLNRAYLKRELTEEEVRKKMFDYKEELHLLEKEKEKSAGKGEVKEEAQPARKEAPIEKKEAPAERREITRTDIKRLKALEKFHKEFTAESSFPPAPEAGGEPAGEEAREEFKLSAPEKRTAPSRGEEKIAEIIREKSRGKISDARIQGMEEKIEKLMKKYSIPKEEMEKELKRVEEAKLLVDFDKLINLIESEHRTHKLVEVVKPEEKTVFIGPAPAKKEVMKGEIKDITSYRIVTDFDKILSLVNEKGEIKTKEMEKELKISGKRIMECCEILEGDGLLRIDYPPIGDSKVIAMNYTAKKKEEKTEAKERKKRAKELSEIIKKAKKEK